MSPNSSPNRASRMGAIKMAVPAASVMREAAAPDCSGAAAMAWLTISG